MKLEDKIVDRSLSVAMRSLAKANKSLSVVMRSKWHGEVARMWASLANDMAVRVTMDPNCDRLEALSDAYNHYLTGQPGKDMGKAMVADLMAVIDHVILPLAVRFGTHDQYLHWEGLYWSLSGTVDSIDDVK